MQRRCSIFLSAGQSLLSEEEVLMLTNISWALQFTQVEADSK